MSHHIDPELQDAPSPGDVLLEKVIQPLGISIPDLAKAIHVPPNRLYLIIQGKRELSIDTAVRLGKYLGMSPEFWLNIQMRHQLKEYLGNIPDSVSDIQPINS